MYHARLVVCVYVMQINNNNNNKHYTTLSTAWWSWQAVLNSIHISQKTKIKNFKQIAISWHLWKQVKVIACPMYNASNTFPGG